jgi:mono/diheme cytochrome c family protein
VRSVLGILALVVASGSPLVAQVDEVAADRSGAELYRAACLSCHGADGKGAPKSFVGFDVPLPDFSDCAFATPEPDIDWAAVIHEGGPARAFDRAMPAFVDALTSEEIDRLVEYLRGFCTDRRWPRGDLNLPRPLVTEKAFPENEAVLTTTVATRTSTTVANQVAYEHRVGPRSQYELVVPFDVRQRPTGGWSRGLGDVAIAFKHALLHDLRRGSIVSAGGEVVLPTGKEQDGLGGGVTIFEPFVAFGQILPRDGFLQLHGGFELPARRERAEHEGFWRIALGKTIAKARWGRAWSPMVEVLGARELSEGARVRWDLLPQMQVTLSKRQHIMVNAGVRFPLNERGSRRTSLVTYFLWDWFDGGLFEGWR